MMRLASWPSILSLLVVVGGTPALLSLDLPGWTVFFADFTAVGFIFVVAHIVGTWRSGHAI